MKAELFVTDDVGQRYSCNCILVPVSEDGRLKPGPAEERESGSTTESELNNPDFVLPARAFVKKYGSGMRGPEKFTLLLAKFANGREGEPVQRAAIEKTWNKMRPLMGGKFNGAYANRAKDNAWVDSPKNGQYVLLGDWKEIFE
jgi:hypothetical protein